MSYVYVGAYLGLVVVSILVVVFIAAFLFRRVVPKNMVDVVQYSKKTVAYGFGEKSGGDPEKTEKERSDEQIGNIYYDWPSKLPLLGVAVIHVPISNFDLSLNDYEAYDIERVPFMVDVTAFFRIVQPKIAAARMESYDHLKDQIDIIVQGAVRKVLSSSDIDTIMLERAKFGLLFTEEVQDQLAEWGVEAVKAMEFMDIRDTAEGKTIENIMAKKISHIEMESRIEVASNHKNAKTAEIDAEQEVDIRKEVAAQAVGERSAEKDQKVGVAEEESKQAILLKEKKTKENSMAVTRVEQVVQAEIDKDKEVVLAQQDKQTTIIIADGQLEAKKKEAAGVTALGEANASAEKAMQLAPVEAQIVLAKEIGKNVGYQQYLISVKGVEAYQVVGTEQAKALQAADVKVISNAGDPVQGTTKVMDMFTSTGGTKIASMVEALSQTPMGGALLKKFGIMTDPASTKKEDLVNETEVPGVTEGDQEAAYSDTEKDDAEDSESKS